MHSQISFKNIKHEQISIFNKLFELIKNGKTIGKIDEEAIKQSLGSIYNKMFWHPSKLELELWEKQWFSTPFDKRINSPELKRPWDFSSWVDSLQNMEIILKDIYIDEHGNGHFDLEQISYPSGGIEAIEELIKIFDGMIIENTMS